MQFSKEKIYKSLPFGLILGLAIFLRFYKIEQFQFDSDELSAIFRAQNALNWHQHIYNGILVDGHPAGVQTFIWLWVKQFSTNLMPLKIIAALFGLANVILTFIVTKKILGLQPAYFAMLCMSILWWEVDLSLWVRPYIFGQFFTLAALWQLDISNKNAFANRRSSILISIFAIGAFYTHHFATLTTFIIIAYVFLFQQAKRKDLLIAFGLFCILAIPQISIVLNQFKNGGLDWLGKPDSSFFINHLFYNFNQSDLLLAFTVLLIGTGLYFNKKQKTPLNLGMTLTFISLWALPMIIGYGYSIHAKPVLQNNVLYFSAPLLFIGIGYFFQSIPRVIFNFSMISFGIVSVFHLFAVKHRYDVEINEVYASQITTLNASLNSKTFNFIDGPNDVFQFHQNNINPSLNLNNHHSILNLSTLKYSIKEFNQMLKSLSGKSTLRFFSNSGTKPELRPLLYYYFPNSKVHSQYIGGQIDEFNITQLADSNYFSKSNNNRRGQFPLILANQTSIYPNVNHSFSFSSDYFGKYIVDQMNDVKKEIQPNDLIVIKLDNNENYADAKIVTALINQKKSIFSNTETQDQIDFRYTQCSDYWNAGFNAAFHVIKLSDIPKWNANTDLRITVETKNITIKNIPISIYRFSGNPFQYGIN